MASSPPEDVLALRRELDAARLEAASERARAGSFAAEIATLKARTVLAYSLGEEEEELRNNTLMKKLAEVNTEKREMLMRVDVEEEFLTNALQKRLDKVLLEKRELELRLTSMVSESTRTQKESLERERVALVKEKVRLELALETEQEAIVNKLTKQTSHLQSEKDCLTLEREQLRKQVASLLLDKNKLHAEKVTLENTLEQEEENIVNRLQTQMLELFTRNQILQRKLEHGVSQTNSVVSESEPELSEDEGGSMRSGRGGGSSRSARHLAGANGNVYGQQPSAHNSGHAPWHASMYASVSRRKSQGSASASSAGTTGGGGGRGGGGAPAFTSSAAGDRNNLHRAESSGVGSGAFDGSNKGYGTAMSIGGGSSVATTPRSSVQNTPLSTPRSAKSPKGRDGE